MLSLSFPGLPVSFIPCFCCYSRHLKLKQSDHPGSLKQQRYPWRRSPFEIKQFVSALLTRLIFFFSSLLEETMSYDVIPRPLRSRSSRSVAVFAESLPLSVCFHGKRTTAKWEQCARKTESIMILQITKILLVALCCPALSSTLFHRNGSEVKLLQTQTTIPISCFFSHYHNRSTSCALNNKHKEMSLQLQASLLCSATFFRP